MHAVHFIGSTYLGFFTILTLKSPQEPSILLTSLKASTVKFGLFVSSNITGKDVQVAHSLVGYILSI